MKLEALAVLFYEIPSRQEKNLKREKNSLLNVKQSTLSSYSLPIDLNIKQTHSKQLEPVPRNDVGRDRSEAQ